MSYFEKRIKPLFEKYELDLSTVTSYPQNSGDKTNLKYTCKCGNSVLRTARLFKTKPFCDKYCPRRKTGKKAPSIESFQCMLEDDDYSFVDVKDDEYVNTKSLVNVIDPLGNIYRTSYNRFKSGHRSPFVLRNSQLLPLKEVRRRVENAGFKWIKGTKYQGKDRPFEMLKDRLFRESGNYF